MKKIFLITYILSIGYMFSHDDHHEHSASLSKANPLIARINQLKPLKQDGVMGLVQERLWERLCTLEDENTRKNLLLDGEKKEYYKEYLEYIKNELQKLSKNPHLQQLKEYSSSLDADISWPVKVGQLERDALSTGLKIQNAFLYSKGILRLSLKQQLRLLLSKYLNLHTHSPSLLEKFFIAGGPLFGIFLDPYSEYKYACEMCDLRDAAVRAKKSREYFKNNREIMTQLAPLLDAILESKIAFLEKVQKEELSQKTSRKDSTPSSQRNDALSLQNYGPSV